MRLEKEKIEHFFAFHIFCPTLFLIIGTLGLFPRKN